MTVATRTSSLSLPDVLEGHGEDGHDLVAVHFAALVVHGQAAVRVAVVGNAQVGAVLAGRPACSGPRWVEPTPSLMLRPSGSAPMTMTSAPASLKTCGEQPLAAPWAQSSTTLRPSRRCGRVPSRWTM